MPESLPSRFVDVATVGNAMVDVLMQADDAFLDKHRLAKGTMQLVEADLALHLHDDMVLHAAAREQPLRQISGGSAANTAVVAAMLGARAGFIGKVSDDDLGDVFAADLESVGVNFNAPRASAGLVPTGRCLVTVTPDAERTMCTFLGAARSLRLGDFDESMIASAQVTYFEGYLWDEPNISAALVEVMHAVHAGGGKVALTLSDPFCVDRFRETWIDLIPTSVDILFGNEFELCSLFETADLDHALSHVRPLVELAAITRSEKGSIVVAGPSTEVIAAFPVPHVADTTGAGDAYAGGFLHGLTSDLPLRRCGELGSLAASEVISHVGARPSPRLAELASHAV